MVQCLPFQSVFPRALCQHRYNNFVAYLANFTKSVFVKYHHFFPQREYHFLLF